MQRLLLRDERRKTAILLISLLSVAVILLILWRHYWRQKRLYRNIVIANRDAVAREQELMARLEAATQPVADDSVDAPVPASAEIEAGEAAEAIPPATAPVPPATRNDSVFDRLCHLMEREQVFRDNGLSRERLAEMLGTNRTYLSQIIADRQGVLPVCQRLPDKGGRQDSVRAGRSRLPAESPGRRPGLQVDDHILQDIPGGGRDDPLGLPRHGQEALTPLVSFTSKANCRKCNILILIYVGLAVNFAWSGKQRNEDKHS